MKMIKRSHRSDINRTRARHGYKYTKYKMCLSMRMVMCNKQHLSNIWSWIHERKKKKINNTEAGLKKSVYKKKHVFQFTRWLPSILAHCGTYFDQLKWEVV